MSAPLFGGWTPTYEGDPCRGGHPPQSTYATKWTEDGKVAEAACGRCGRRLDLRRCLCGEESHRGGLSRSFCPNRMRFDQFDAETHAGFLASLGSSPDTMSVTQAAARLDVHPNTVRNMCSDGRLDYVRISSGYLRPLRESVGRVVLDISKDSRAD